MPNFFSRTIASLAQKMNPAWLGFASYSDTPQAVHMSRSYKAYAKEGYKNSDTLYKCISYIIRNGAASAVHAIDPFKWMESHGGWE